MNGLGRIERSSSCFPDLTLTLQVLHAVQHNPVLPRRAVQTISVCLCLQRRCPLTGWEHMRT